MNKRDFIAGASASALTAACAPVLASDARHGDVEASAVPATRRPVPLEGRQSRAAWQQYLGHNFEVTGGVLRLVAVNDAPLSSPGLEQFCLVFDSPTPLDLGSAAGVHTLRHVTGQRLALWLQAAGGSRWHAHFNLLA